MSESAVRTAIVEVNAELERLRMNVCSTGNISVRWNDGMLITPAGCRVEILAPEHIVFTRFDGTWDGPLRPSSEFAMHRSVYEHAPNAKAVVHTHADHCVALSTFRQAIPSFHYMVNGFGGMDVPCVDYRPFGSDELGDAAGQALRDRTACLLANHGMLARGATLLSAFETTLETGDPGAAVSAGAQHWLAHSADIGGMGDRAAAISHLRQAAGARSPAALATAIDLERRWRSAARPRSCSSWPIPWRISEAASC